MHVYGSSNAGQHEGHRQPTSDDNAHHAQHAQHAQGTHLQSHQQHGVGDEPRDVNSLQGGRARPDEHIGPGRPRSSDGSGGTGGGGDGASAQQACGVQGSGDEMRQHLPGSHSRNKGEGGQSDRHHSGDKHGERSEGRSKRGEGEGGGGQGQDDGDNQHEALERRCGGSRQADEQHKSGSGSLDKDVHRTHNNGYITSESGHGHGVQGGRDNYRDGRMPGIAQEGGHSGTAEQDEDTSDRQTGHHGHSSRHRHRRSRSRSREHGRRRGREGGHADRDGAKVPRSGTGTEHASSAGSCRRDAVRSRSRSRGGRDDAKRAGHGGSSSSDGKASGRDQAPAKRRPSKLPASPGSPGSNVAASPRKPLPPLPTREEGDVGRGRAGAGDAQGTGSCTTLPPPPPLPRPPLMRNRLPADAQLESELRPQMPSRPHGDAASDRIKGTRNSKEGAGPDNGADSGHGSSGERLIASATGGAGSSGSRGDAAGSRSSAELVSGSRANDTSSSGRPTKAGGGGEGTSGSCGGKGTGSSTGHGSGAAPGSKKRLLLSFEDEVDELSGEGGEGDAGRPGSKSKPAPPTLPPPRPMHNAWSLSSSRAGPALVLRKGAPAGSQSGTGSGAGPASDLASALGLGAQPLLGLDLGRALGLRLDPGSTGLSGFGGGGADRLTGARRGHLSPDSGGGLSGDFLGGGSGSARAASDSAQGLGQGSGQGPHAPDATSPGRLGAAVVFGVAQARNQRPYMEDRHVLVHCLRPLTAAGQPAGGEDGVPRNWAAVFDGHNGSRAAEFAAQRLHHVFASDPAVRAHGGGGGGGPPAAQAAEETAIAGAMRRAFRSLDDELMRMSRADGMRDGATALVVARLGDSLYAAHAGDSRAVLCRGGAPERLTEDHKPNLVSERSRVEAAGGRVEFQRCWRVVVEPRDGRPGSGLAVSRSLGDLDFKEPKRFVESEPDVRRLLLQPGDSYVILGSDGLWDVLSDKDAIQCANKVLNVSLSGGLPVFSHPGQAQSLATAAAEALLQLSLQRGTVDNVTVVVMLLQWG